MGHKYRVIKVIEGTPERRMGRRNMHNQEQATLKKKTQRRDPVAFLLSSPSSSSVLLLKFLIDFLCVIEFLCVLLDFCLLIISAFFPHARNQRALPERAEGGCAPLDHHRPAKRHRADAPPSGRVLHEGCLPATAVGVFPWFHAKDREIKERKMRKGGKEEEEEQEEEEWGGTTKE